MKLKNLSKLIAALVVAATFEFGSVGKVEATDAYKIIGLTSNNSLVSFEQKSGKPNKPVRVKGIDGNLLGIDFRPADGLLYGVTDTDKIYTINPNSGAATFVSTLSISFNGGFQSGVDFNPVADRLRITGSNDQNYRVNVDTGEVIADGELAYVAGDANAGVDPNITASAYTNSRPGVTATQLYNIDYDLDVLALQNPPNDGGLVTIGSLGVNFAPIAGFDIFTDNQGRNTAFAVSGSQVYTINLQTGAATKLGQISNGGFVGLAVTAGKRNR